jgi:hypothetical protein
MPLPLKAVSAELARVDAKLARVDAKLARVDAELARLSVKPNKFDQQLRTQDKPPAIWICVSLNKHIVINGPVKPSQIPDINGTAQRIRRS